MKRYHGQRLGSLAPHIFGIADAAYGNLNELCKNQSIIISGESDCNAGYVDYL